MGLVETEGVILKTYSLAEADKIVVLLTENEGLIRGVAKGAKRLKSRFGGGLEPFSIIHISYFQKEERELVSIGRVELVRSFFEAAGNPRFLQKFSYLAELLLEFAPPHDPNERLYRMARVCLETAAADAESLDSIGLYFELWILKLGGYLPDWNKCSNCKKQFTASEPASLQINFQIFCPQCQFSRNNSFVSPEQRRLFADAQRFSPTKFVEAAKDQRESIREISKILRRLISNILGRETIEEKILTANI
jgi:DNA repair protein RecO (recombination protein O)